MIWQFYTWFIGDVDGGTLQSKSVDSLGQQFLDLLHQASWCHVGTAGSLWLHRCGMGCYRLWCRGIPSEQLAWQGQLEPVSPGLPVLQVQQIQTACVVQVGVMKVVPLRSGVLTEPAVWQWCHLEQCQLLWHCIHGGVSMCSSMWNYCWCILDSCSRGGCVSQ